MAPPTNRREQDVAARHAVTHADRGGVLSEGEQRIARLVTEGLTNREIAAELALSEKTVEWTLTRIYRKAGVRSRTELAVRLAADHEPGGIPWDQEDDK